MTRYMYLKSYKPCKVSLICEPGGKFMLHVRGREEFFDSSDERMMIYYIYGVGDSEKFSEYLCMCAKLIPLNEKDLEAVITEFKSQREVVPIVKYPLERIPLIATKEHDLIIKDHSCEVRFTLEQEKALTDAIQKDPTREAVRGYCKTLKKLNGWRGVNHPKYLSPLTYQHFLHLHGISSLKKRKLKWTEQLWDGFLVFFTFYGQMIIGGCMFAWGMDGDFWEDPLWLRLIMMALGAFLFVEPFLLFNEEYRSHFEGRGTTFMKIFKDLDWYY